MSTRMIRNRRSPMAQAAEANQFDPVTAAIASGGSIVNDQITAASNRRQAELERRMGKEQGSRDRQLSRDQLLVDLILEAISIDERNQGRAKRAEFNQTTGFSDEMLRRQMERMAPRAPVTGFRQPGEAPPQGPGQGSGSNAALPPDQLMAEMGVGSFENYRRMKARGQAPALPGPVQAKDPIEELSRIPGLRERFEPDSDFFGRGPGAIPQNRGNDGRGGY